MEKGYNLYVDKTLKTMASCMIKAKSLDPTLEVEAISSATHILNKSPHNALEGRLLLRHGLIENYL